MVVGLQAVVPGFLDRYGATFAPDEVAFYERFTRSAGNWFAARPAGALARYTATTGPTTCSSPRASRPDGRGRRLAGLLARLRRCRDVSFLIGNALTPEVRRAHEERSSCARYHDDLVAAGVATYPFDECWDDYACSLLSALLTTIFGAMYGARTERGDRMFELMGGRHARQILDLGADRFLDD